MGQQFTSGKYAKAICDRCGDKVWYTHLRLEWTGLKVCRTCWDPKTALEFPTNFPADAEALRDPRPDNDVEASYGKAVIGAIAHSDSVLNTPVADNLLSAPNDFSDSAWIPIGDITVTTDAAIAPDGKMTADILEDDDLSVTERLYQTVTIDPTLYYLLNVFIKKDNIGRATRFPQLVLQYIGASAELNSVSLDTSTGDISTSFVSTGVSAGADDMNNYWRLWIVGRSNSLNTSAQNFFFPARGASAGWAISNSARGSITAWGAALYQTEFETNDIGTSFQLNDIEIELGTVSVTLI